MAGWRDNAHHIGWCRTHQMPLLSYFCFCDSGISLGMTSLFFLLESLRQELAEQRSASEQQKALEVLQNEQRALGPLGKWQCSGNNTNHTFIAQVSALPLPTP